MIEIQNFYKICDRIKAEWKSPNQISEEHLIDALNFIKNNKLYRHQFLNYFMQILNGDIDMPIELVEFCMRELQWIEIKNFVVQKLEAGDPRTQHAMERILKVYEIKWEDADLYQYYSNDIKK